MPPDSNPPSNSTDSATSVAADSRSARRSDEKPGELKLVSPPKFDDAPQPADGPGPSNAPLGASAAPGPSISEPDPATATARPGRDSGASEALRPPIWLIVLVFMAFSAALGWQFRVAGQLERQIVGLEQELRETHVQLGAHQSRLAEIRGGVHDLAIRLEGLRVLVDGDPSEAVAVVDFPAAEPGNSIPARLPAE